MIILTKHPTKEGTVMNGKKLYAALIMPDEPTIIN
jgi:hypothetical protein